MFKIVGTSCAVDFRCSQASCWQPRGSYFLTSIEMNGERSITFISKVSRIQKRLLMEYMEMKTSSNGF